MRLKVDLKSSAESVEGSNHRRLSADDVLGIREVWIRGP